MADNANYGPKCYKHPSMVKSYYPVDNPHNIFDSQQFTSRLDIRIPNTSISLLLFPFSLDGEARDWLDKEPPRSILTWDDLVAKFINQFFPPSKTTYLRNEITTFYQKPNETFNEAWERFKGLLRQCPHHGFSELHQLDTFYNSLNTNDQDALDSAAGGNFLDKMPREGKTLENFDSSCSTPDVSILRKEPEIKPEDVNGKMQNPKFEKYRTDDPFSGSTTNTLPPSSSPMKTSDNLEKFADELAPLDSLPPGNEIHYYRRIFSMK
ncbi:reverse transcriptase domain-containing protein [Tanacetum coccineum]|uniref:Reverse transcriptase domain-containing protein n=1 Tax=Tanacetum coccineum TaxID=301880 RepID=A0ABQ4YQ64_9ASTR